jgi:dynein heavy chain
MTSKLPNPHYPPEVCIKVTLINFTVTFEGLEEQLLGDVVIKEKPEVEEKRDKIVVQMADDKKTLKKIENTILKMLSESTEEQILDEDDLTNVLDSSKITSAEINIRLD